MPVVTSKNGGSCRSGYAACMPQSPTEAPASDIFAPCCSIGSCPTGYSLCQAGNNSAGCCPTQGALASIERFFKND